MLSMFKKSKSTNTPSVIAGPEYKGLPHHSAAQCLLVNMNHNDPKGVFNVEGFMNGNLDRWCREYGVPSYFRFQTANTINRLFYKFKDIAKDKIWIFELACTKDYLEKNIKNSSIPLSKLIIRAINLDDCDIFYNIDSHHAIKFIDNKNFDPTVQIILEKSEHAKPY